MAYFHIFGDIIYHDYKIQEFKDKNWPLYKPDVSYIYQQRNVGKSYYKLVLLDRVICQLIRADFITYKTSTNKSSNNGKKKMQENDKKNEK